TRNPRLAPGVFVLVSGAGSGCRLAAGDLCQVRIVAGSHPPDIALEIVVALRRVAHRRFETGTERVGGEREHGGVDPARLGAEEVRLRAEVSGDGVDRVDPKSNDLVARVAAPALRVQGAAALAADHRDHDGA